MRAYYLCIIFPQNKHPSQFAMSIGNCHQLNWHTRQLGTYNVRANILHIHRYRYKYICEIAY